MLIANKQEILLTLLVSPRKNAQIAGILQEILMRWYLTGNIAEIACI
jgi:hypothetical protein